MTLLKVLVGVALCAVVAVAEECVCEGTSSCIPRCPADGTEDIEDKLGCSGVGVFKRIESIYDCTSKSNNELSCESAEESKLTEKNSFTCVEDGEGSLVCTGSALDTNATCVHSITTDKKAVTLTCKTAETTDSFECTTEPLLLINQLPVIACILLLYIFIGLGLGASFEPVQFKIVVQNEKKAFFAGFGSQFLIMPITAYILGQIVGAEDLPLIGLVLCGVAPGGTTSNIMAYWMNGNVPLSIAMSMMSTLCSIFMIPLWITILLSGMNVDYQVSELVVSALASIIPLFLGMFSGFYLRHKAKDLDKWPRRAEITGSFLGAFFLLVLIILAFIDYTRWGQGTVTEFVVGLLLQPLGCSFGCFIAWAVGLNFRDIRTVASETGVQNLLIPLAICVFNFSGRDLLDSLRFVLIATVGYVAHSTWITYMFYRLGPKLDKFEFYSSRKFPLWKIHGWELERPFTCWECKGYFPAGTPRYGDRRSAVFEDYCVPCTTTKRTRIVIFPKLGKGEKGQAESSQTELAETKGASDSN